MDARRIMELRRLAEVATRGEWDCEFFSGDVAQVFTWNGPEPQPGVPMAGGPREDITCDHLRSADAIFIAAARTAVPELLDALEAAERERDRLQKAGACARCGVQFADQPPTLETPPPLCCACAHAVITSNATEDRDRLAATGAGLRAALTGLVEAADAGSGEYCNCVLLPFREALAAARAALATPEEP